MENEENVEPSMAYNTEYQENNFKADFINSSKMNKIMWVVEYIPIFRVCDHLVAKIKSESPKLSEWIHEI